MIDKTKLLDRPLYEPTIVVDFDGTICDFAFPDMGKPKKGVRESLEKLQKKGYKIVIHSVRTNKCWEGHEQSNGDTQEKAIEDIQDYMKENEIPYDYIYTPDKPLAMYYIDDRAVWFNDDETNDWKMIARCIPEPDNKSQIQNIRKDNGL